MLHILNNDPWVAVKQDRDVRSMLDTLRKTALPRSGARARGRGAILRRLSAPARTRQVAAVAAPAEEPPDWLDEGGEEDAGSLRKREVQKSLGELCEAACCCCSIPVINLDGRLHVLEHRDGRADRLLRRGGAPRDRLRGLDERRHGRGRPGGPGGVNLVVDAIFLVDILINFRTSFLIEGYMVRDDLAIASTTCAAPSSSTSSAAPLNFILSR